MHEQKGTRDGAVNIADKVDKGSLHVHHTVLEKHNSCLACRADSSTRMN